MSKQEIEAMLIGELPDLEDTRSGKDLIAIGEARGIKEGKKEGIKEGRKEGMIKSVLVFLEAKHGPMSKPLQKAISNLSAAQANRLLARLPQCETLEDVQRWLDKNA
jgi:predicted transposase YdaD